MNNYIKIENSEEGVNELSNYAVKIIEHFGKPLINYTCQLFRQEFLYVHIQIKIHHDTSDITFKLNISAPELTRTKQLIINSTDFIKEHYSKYGQIELSNNFIIIENFDLFLNDFLDKVHQTLYDYSVPCTVELKRIWPNPVKTT